MEDQQRKNTNTNITIEGLNTRSSERKKVLIPKVETKFTIGINFKLEHLSRVLVGLLGSGTCLGVRN